MRISVAASIAVAAMSLLPIDGPAQSCPLPEGTLGYAIVATSRDSLEQSFLAEVAEAAAYRWLG